MTSSILIITANPLLDCLHDGIIIPGTVTRSQGMKVVAGGKGLNVGRILTNHGHRVIATGFAGGWSGHAFRDIVRGEGQEDAFIDCAARLRIGFLAKDCVEAGSTAVLENGFAVTQEEQQALIDTVRNHVSECHLVVISGSVPSETCTQLFVPILDICHQASIPCWIDSYGPAMDAALSHHCPPSLVKPNRQEYETSTLWSHAQECHITDGGASTNILTPDATFTVIPPEIDCINPIGSGDSYIGALAHARLSGQSLPDQLSYATAAGSINAAQMAVANMQPSEIQTLSSAAQIHKNDKSHD